MVYSFVKYDIVQTKINFAKFTFENMKAWELKPFPFPTYLEFGFFFTEFSIFVYFSLVVLYIPLMLWF